MGEQAQRREKIEDSPHYQNRERDQRGKIMTFGESREVTVMASVSVSCWWKANS